METPSRSRTRSLICSDQSREPDRVLFDYDRVSSSVAKFLKGQAYRIKRQCVTSIIQIGKALLEAKHHLSHGEFVHWVESEAGIPARTAQAYMRVAHWASNKRATVAHLAPSTLYLLSASSTPEQFVSDVLDRIEAGETIPPAALRRQLAAMRRIGGHAGAERRTSRSSSMANMVRGRQGVSAMALAELVEILVRGLSETDFVRVRCIATDEAILSDSRLAENLQRAFASYDNARTVLVSVGRDIEERMASDCQ